MSNQPLCDVLPTADVVICQDSNAGVEALLRVVAEGDLVLTLGAGNVWQAGEKLLDRLRPGAGN